MTVELNRPSWERTPHRVAVDPSPSSGEVLSPPGPEVAGTITAMTGPSTYTVST